MTLIFPSSVKKTTKSPAGSVTPTSASVTFPRSFFIKAYKNFSRSDSEPSDAVLAPFITAELEKSRNVVMACLNLTNEKSLVVETYFDLLPAAVEAPAQVTGVAMLFSGHAKEIVLGVLALASLFMVSMLVRKSAPPMVAMAGHGSSSSMPSVGSTVDAMLTKAGLKAMVSEDAAEVGAGGQALDGVELDDNTIRAQQVVEQVTNLAKENPDVAASMIKRWMNRA
jgi:flagellar biosynthesis/type III secretory pathway M-ring protein FliF/YscJ